MPGDLVAERVDAFRAHPPREPLPVLVDKVDGYMSLARVTNRIWPVLFWLHSTVRERHLHTRLTDAGVVYPVATAARDSAAQRATATSLGVLTDAWLLVSIALTAIAAALLVLRVLPRQQALLTETDTPGDDPEPTTTSATAAPARLAAYTGVFNLLWATVTVLMIVRPGSTTVV
ncbi:hypothetical protein EDC02_0879 [Micromonospora sp. Llam0]|uniref:hypothetical protein n=1 Tax=Micromonospora sp. Llam0 TaxID=2485143 RepID=UPI000FC2335D|nr:hypothetical protein [Micromonospora sp. Llam0]ROO59094.1 hypothetical protein EDC02_0879 [Micromonospora sp. Llam0]